MKVPYRKILTECRLSGDEKRDRQRKMRENVYVPNEPDNVFIDHSMAEIVEVINRSGIQTFGSCSAVFDEHYRLEGLRMRLPYKQLLDSLELTVHGISEPSLSTEPFYHERVDDGYRVSDRFYNMRKEIKEETYDIDRQSEF